MTNFHTIFFLGRQPGDDNKMLVCDTCDKGYHTFCLKPAMTTIPKNGWKCKVSRSKPFPDVSCLVYKGKTKQVVGAINLATSPVLVPGTHQSPIS